MVADQMFLKVLEANEWSLIYRWNYDGGGRWCCGDFNPGTPGYSEMTPGSEPDLTIWGRGDTPELAITNAIEAMTEWQNKLRQPSA